MLVLINCQWILMTVNVVSRFYDFSTIVLRCALTASCDGIFLRRQQHGNATWSEMAMPSRRATQSNIDKHEIGSKRLYTCHRFNMVQYDSIAQDPCDSGMGSEEGMELRDVLLLNLRLAGRRKSAPASAKHEDHILNEPLRFPWCSQCFVSKYPGTTAEELNVCLRVYTCVCV